MEISTREWFMVLSTIQSLKTDLDVQQAFLRDIIVELREAGTLSHLQVTRLVDESSKRRALLEEDEPAAEHPTAPRDVVLTESGVVAGFTPVLKDRLQAEFACLLDRAYFEMGTESGGEERSAS